MGVGPAHRKSTSAAKYFRLPMTSMALRSGIPFDPFASTLGEALPNALRKTSSGPVGGTEGEGPGVLGAGARRGRSGDRRFSRRLPTASRSGNTPTSQAAVATRERSADTANRIVNPPRIPTMGSSPRRYGRGHCTSAGGSSEGAFAVCQGYADEHRRSVLKGASAVLQRKYSHVAYLLGPLSRP